MRSLVPPVALMAAAPTPDWPAGDDWLFEPKFDGWRGCVFRLADRVVLQSRTGRDLSRYFPEVSAAAAVLPPGTVVDGELVAYRDGRVDFAALQLRVAGTGREIPVHLICFDLLQHPRAGVIIDRALLERRELLAQTMTPEDPVLTLCPQSGSRDQGDEWLRHWGPAGVEGVVVKREGGRYRLGRRDWLKRRARHTIDLIVGGFTGTVEAPQSLLLGEHVGRRFVFRGRTLTLTTRQARELVSLLRTVAAPRSASPWPEPLPARWANLTGQQPVDYTPTYRVLTVEVDADEAFEHGRYRHALRYRRVRLDLEVI